MGSTNKESVDGMLTVGLGASAGGVEPLKQFFDSLPPETGMAFIVIMHLSPDHKSNMAELLQRKTSLNVLEVKERSKINPDHVYVIPPDKMLSLQDSHLELSEPDREKKSHVSVDLFFRTLGEAKGQNAAGIILSGSGADGSAGIKQIKEQGGLTIAQDPAEAEYSGMPESAVDMGVIDVVLPVENMTQKLLEYQDNLHQIAPFKEHEDKEEVFRSIFEKLRSETGHDFSNYKRTTIQRRIKRRMQINSCLTLDSYFNYLDEHPNEVEILFKDLLISVTSFFRDAEAFEALNEKVIPKLFEEKKHDDQLRIWVTGCATGEEAYSIAILLREYMQNIDSVPDIQIFATDINKDVLKNGRQGIYPESIAADLSEERLEQHFKKSGHKYQLKPEITKMVLFARHDLLRDPPFSDIDLIACRNLLIYLNREIQSEVFKLFKYALRPGGWLFLGLSDSNLEATELFNALDKKHRIYQKSTSSDSHSVLPELPLHFKNKQFLTDPNNQKLTRQKMDIGNYHRNMLLRLYAPQSVIISEEYDVIHATEGIDRYLEYGGGQPSANILEMVKSELRQVLRSLLYQLEEADSANKQKKAVIGLEEGDRKEIDIIVHRLSKSQFPEGFIHVVFKEAKTSQTFVEKNNIVSEADISQEEMHIIEGLEKELQETKEQLQLTVEEYETSNEELRSSNEELQSMNEELRSATEELETSHEELQSVNKELENKIEKLRQANSDLKNLMKAAEVAIVFVDSDFTVHRFTDNAQNIFNLIPSDKGRPLQHVTHRLKYNSLEDDISHVYDTLDEVKKVVSSRDDQKYIMRLRPYRSLEDKIEGVILTFMDVTELKEAEEKLKQQKLQKSLAAIGTYALGKNDLNSIIHRALQQICVGLDAEYSTMFSWYPDENVIRILDATGWEPSKDEEAEIEADAEWDIGYALKKESPAVVTSYSKEERFKLSPLLDHLDIRSGITIKIIESNQICGVLGVYFEEERILSEGELNFVKIASNIIGTASENQKTKESLQETNEQLEEEIERSKKYQREILQNSIVERWNLGGYLHDTLAQILVSIKVMVSSMKSELKDANIDLSSQINMILENIDDGIEGIRNLTHEIIPVDIEEEGVEHAFRLLLRQLKKTHELNCVLNTSDVIDKINDQEVATNLYHIIQEAVKNAAVHGEAKNVVIEVKEEGKNLELRITDDGIGFSNSEYKNGEGSGLNIMRHRIELLGGSFSIGEVPQEDETGTRIICTLPLEHLEGTDKD